MNDRELAYKILCRIFNDEVLCQDALSAAFEEADKKEGAQGINKGWVNHLVVGVVERYLTLTYLIEKQSGRKFNKINKNVRIILLMGVYQGLYMNVPSSAACNESVKLATKHKLAGLKGFVNGVLRGLFRAYEASGKTTAEEFILSLTKEEKDADRKLEILYSTPKWMIKEFRKAAGTKDITAILESQFTEKDMTACLIKSRATKEEFEAALTRDGVEFRECENLKAYAEDFTYYTLNAGGKLNRLSSFKKGMFIVQDPASMLASELVPVKEEMKVIDVCAAPGGKAVHLADRIYACAGHVTACDVSEEKVGKIQDTIKRTGLKNITTAVADATVKVKEFNDFFDVVVADLPCSGLGVIKKKPDIKYKTKETDPAELAVLQKKILDNVTGYVKKKGFIAFSTCTLTECENEANVSYLQEKGFEEIKRVKLLPTAEHDGFFICLLQKA